MGIPLRLGPVFGGTVVAVALLAGCADVHEDESDGPVPPLLQRYAEVPEPGTAIVFPLIPLPQTPGNMDGENLLSDPGFRFGQVDWSVSGSQEAVCTKTDLLCTEGPFCLQVLPSPGGDAFISQAVAVKPRTFYSFSAYVFAPGASEAALEVRDAAGTHLLSSEPLRGSMPAWSHISLTFVTGFRKEEIAVGIRCQDLDGNAPILIDQCALHAIPTENFVESGTMETAPEEGRMAEWYCGGRSVSPTAEGYQSKYAVELPLLNDRASSLLCLIPMREQLEGRAVWISAMVKSVSDGNAPPPEVTVALRLGDDAGEQSRISTTCAGTGEWVETTLLATMPGQASEDKASVPPFHALFFERPPGVDGRVFIDDVVMLGVPEGRFDGGLASATPSR